MPRPVTMTSAPTTRKARPRAAPAARRTTPRDSTRGATVGRGISTEFRSAGLSDCGTASGWLAIRVHPLRIADGRFTICELLPSHQVDHREDHYPDAVHKVP